MSHGLAERLVTEGLAKREDVELALENAPRGGRSLAEMLVEMGAGDELAIFREAAAERGVKLERADELFKRVDVALSRSLPLSQLCLRFTSPGRSAASSRAAQ